MKISPGGRDLQPLKMYAFPKVKSRCPLKAAAYLSTENHSLGEWFKRRLLPMM